MPESSLEKLVPEQDFATVLGNQGEALFRLANTLLGAARESWTKRHYFELYTEVDELESFLDDYGARYNQTYAYLTELIASMRSFSLAGLSIEHLYRRIEGYGVLDSLEPTEAEAARDELRGARNFVHRVLTDFLTALEAEALQLGVAYTSSGLARGALDAEVVRFRLPRNVDQEDIVDEEQRIAEVATKYLQACEMLREVGIRKIDSEPARSELLAKRCSEEHARVYEATVHNLQSAYDTHIMNTVLEAGDSRLALLRGHVSAVLHFLEASTQLTHFVERHESGGRSEAAETLLAKLVSRSDVHDVILNTLLFWAGRLMDLGRPLAEALLPAYTNVQTLSVEVGESLMIHARPASLIVAIVNHHGTPVELEVRGKRCNAGSILELLVLVGSFPDERTFQFSGDENPLRDIGLLFEHDLAENGIELLPAELAYLRGGPP